MTHWTEQLLARGLAAPDQIEGLSQAEIQVLETRCGVVLPQVYRDFLLGCGRRAGALGRTINLLSPGPVLLARSWQEIVSEEELELPLPEGSFFIAGYDLSFDYFVCDGSPDPAVYRATPDLPFAPEQISPSFSAYLQSLLEATHPHPPPPPAYHIGPEGQILPGLVDALGDPLPED
ncbi:MAG: SMI1/KNR4 family protein [Candidatus Sericytochromatia bacterium]